MSEQAPTWPDWQDAGRTVEVTYDDGRCIRGRLEVEDLMSTDYDEIPHFVVRGPDDARHSFVDAATWRYCDAIPATAPSVR